MGPTAHVALRLENPSMNRRSFIATTLATAITASSRAQGGKPLVGKDLPAAREAAAKASALAHERMATMIAAIT